MELMQNQEKWHVFIGGVKEKGQHMSYILNHKIRLGFLVFRKNIYNFQMRECK